MMTQDNIQILSFAKSNEASEHAIQKINSLLDKNKKKPILLLLSGGSSLSLIDGIEAKHLTESLTITVLDERYSRDENVNNFAQIAHTDFYEMLTRHDSHVIDTRIRHKESQLQLKDRFEHSLRDWIKNNKGGKIIATIGIGIDGHISGMMPYPKQPHLFTQLFENRDWIASYDAKNKNPYPLRVTTTMTFLKQISYAVVYIVGTNKKVAFNNALREDKDLYKYPARILHKMKKVFIYTDII